jgi:hypothetical protein
MPIRLIQGASFDPETTRLLGLAYERACESVSEDVTIRETVARRIIWTARRGERDLETLVKYALDDLPEAGGLASSITLGSSGDRT